jgi:DeoR/GlpR family transcriptional regulator of sugar metabolism
MMLAAARRALILLDLESRSAVEVTELARHFGVSVSTIRRDLDRLAMRGDLTRVHGGALALGFGDFTVPPSDWVTGAASQITRR